MKILEQLVELKIGPSNITHFKKLNYDIKIGDVIYVPINHLTKSSSVLVKTECTLCGAIKYIQYAGAKRHNDICNSCNAKLVTNKYSGTRVKKGIKRPSILGSKNPNWKDGKTELSNMIRTSIENKAWILDIFKRDNFTCQNCGDDKGHNLNVHHIIELKNIIKKYKITKDNWIKHKLILFDIKNGITLCKNCHINIHKNKNMRRN